MTTVTVRLYAELNDHLEPARRQRAFEVDWPRRRPLRELLARLGVPPAEVELALVGGRSVGLEEPIEAGDRVSLLPVFETLDVTPLLAVRRRPLRRSRFVLDTHLGRLAVQLRMLGFDALYRNDFDDPELVRISAGEGRILLTRDRGLLRRKAVTHGYRVRATEPRRQLVEVVDRFDLRRSAAPFTRCLRCNRRLRPVPQEAVESRLPERVRRDHDELRLCPGCDRLLWKGSHHARMKRWVDTVLASPASDRQD